MYVNAGATLFALNAITGERIWTMSLDDSLEARGRGPSYGDGRLYAMGGATMYATDAKTGELVESFGDGGRLEIISEALEFKYPDDYPPGVAEAAGGDSAMDPVRMPSLRLPERGPWRREHLKRCPAYPCRR